MTRTNRHAKRLAALASAVEGLENRTMLAGQPLLYWHFNAPPDSGDAVTNSGAAGATYNGTFIPGGAGGPNRINRDNTSGDTTQLPAVNLNGTTHVFETATPLQSVLGRTASLSAWVRTTALGTANAWTAPGIAGIEDAGAGNDVFWGFMNGTGRIAIAAGNGAAAASVSPINDNTWHHVVFTRDMVTGVVQTYVDGQLNATATSETGEKANQQDQFRLFRTIGGIEDEAAGAMDEWSGGLDEVAIFDRVLSANEVLSIYTGAAGALPNGAAPSVNVTGVVDSASALDVTWNDTATNELGYEILRSSTGVNGTYNIVGTVAPDTTTFRDTRLSPGTTYHYKVQAFTLPGAGPQTSPGVAGQTPLPGDFAAAGAVAEYFNSSVPTLNEPNFGPTATRVSVVRVNDVNFDWTNNSPEAGVVNNDNFSTRFSGKLNIPTAGDYKFGVAGDDGIYLYIDGNLVVADPGGHGIRNTLQPDTINLTAGEHTFLLIQGEGTGGAGARMIYAPDPLVPGTVAAVPAAWFLTDVDLPTAPAAPTFTATSRTLTVNWQDVSNNETDWRVEIADNPAFTGATVLARADRPIVSPGNMSHTATGLQPNTAYHFRIIESNITGEASTTGSFTTLAETTAPVAPSGVTVTPANVGGVWIRWTDNSVDESGFRILRSTTGTPGSFVQAGTVSENGTQFIDVGQTPAATYHYIVESFNPIGGSPSTSASGVAGNPALTGFTARFYNNVNHTDPVVLTRLDPQVDFNWGNNSPGTGVNVDNFSSRWEGQFVAEQAGLYTFATDNDDGSRIWIDLNQDGDITDAGEQIHEFWVGQGQGAVDFATPVLLQPGIYRMRWHQYEGGGGAGARILVKGPGAANATILPQRLMLPDFVGPVPAGTAPSGLTATSLPHTGRVRLAWTDNTTDEQGFIVQRSDGPGLAYVTIATLGAGTQAFIDQTVPAGGNVSYQVQAFNIGGTVGPSTPPASAAVGPGPFGTGAPATYYDNDNFTGPTFQRVDPTIDFAWGNGSPVPGVIGPDTFSTRWEFELVPDFTENYTFFTDNDDGTRVFIDGVKVIERWVGQGQGTRESSVVPGGGEGQGGFAGPNGTPLVAGQRYNVIVEQYEGAGGAGARFYWQSPSQPVEIVPTRAMHAASTTSPLKAPVAFDAATKFNQRAQLTWGDPNLNETGYEVLRTGPNDNNFTSIAVLPANTTTFVDAGPLQDGATYQYKVRAIRNTDVGPDSTVDSDIAFITKLPAPWLEADVGTPSTTPGLMADPALIGGASYDAGTGRFTIQGGGHDIWDAADGFHFAYQQLTGDFVITAHVIDIQNTDVWAKSGVMVREKLTGGSRHGYMAITPGNQAHFQGRITEDTAGAALINHANPPGGVNNTGWVRLVRQGDTIRGFYSTDGQNWVRAGDPNNAAEGSLTLPGLPQTVYVGLAVTAHNNALITTSNIDNVSFGVPDTVAPTITAVDVDAPFPTGATYSTNQHVVVRFSEAVSGLDGDDITIFTADNQFAAVGSQHINVEYNAASNSAILTFHDLPGTGGSTLADGNYVMEIQGATIIDLGGNQLDGDPATPGTGDNFRQSFYFFQGDTQDNFDGTANPDRKITFADYQIMSRNFGKTNPTHAEGDFDRDGDIDHDDFLLVQARMNTTLPPPPPAAAPVQSPAPAPVPVTPAPAPAPRPAPVSKPKPVIKLAPAKAAAPVAKAVSVSAPVKKFATRKIGANDLLS